MKLNVKAFALTSGIIFGVGFMLATWWLLARNAPGEVISKYATFFIGYTYSFIGGFIGLIWAFIYGLVLGGAFSWIYNKLVGTKTG